MVDVLRRRKSAQLDCGVAVPSGVILKLTPDEGAIEKPFGIGRVARSLATKSFIAPRAMRVQYRILFLEAAPCVDSDPVALGRKGLSHERIEPEPGLSFRRARNMLALAPS
jgi:hypothetical protein